MASRHMALVSLMSAMSKPYTSVVELPRPVPNSKRLFGEVVEQGDVLGDAHRLVHLAG